MPRLRNVIAIAIAGLVLPSVAVADAIPPPPRCPPGSRGLATHAGSRCLATPCYAGQGCVSEECTSLRVCEQPATVTPAGRAARREAQVPLREAHVVETCAPNAGCTGRRVAPPPSTGEPAGPIVCRVSTFCVAEEPPLPPASLDLGGGPDSAGWPAPPGLLPPPGQASRTTSAAALEQSGRLPREHGRALEQPDIAGDELPLFHREPPPSPPSSCVCGIGPSEGSEAGVAMTLLSLALIVWRMR